MRLRELARLALVRETHVGDQCGLALRVREQVVAVPGPARDGVEHRAVFVALEPVGIEGRIAEQVVGKLEFAQRAGLSGAPQEPEAHAYLALGQGRVGIDVLWLPAGSEQLRAEDLGGRPGRLPQQRVERIETVCLDEPRHGLCSRRVGEIELAQQTCGDIGPLPVCRNLLHGEAEGGFRPPGLVIHGVALDDRRPGERGVETVAGGPGSSREVEVVILDGVHHLMHEGQHFVLAECVELNPVLVGHDPQRLVVRVEAPDQAQLVFKQVLGLVAVEVAHDPEEGGSDFHPVAFLLLRCALPVDVLQILRGDGPGSQIGRRLQPPHLRHLLEQLAELPGERECRLTTVGGNGWLRRSSAPIRS